VLVTAFDIIFFWVARMMMMGIHFMGDVPFHDVFIHNRVLDEHGQKMSKTKGNVVDPLGLMDKYGTDALRFTLAGLAVPGVRDVRITDDRLEASRNFANKLWNAARLVLSNLDGYDDGRAAALGGGDLAERWIRHRLDVTVAAVREHLDRYRFNDAASALYQFVWSDYCDWYLEIAKLSLYRPESPEARLRTQGTLVTVLEATLRLLHPFMPFITEEIWQRLPGAGESIMIAPYPRVEAEQGDAAAAHDMDLVMTAVTAIRGIRGEMRIAPGMALSVTIRPAPDDEALFAATAALIAALARAQVGVDPRATRQRDTALAVLGSSEIYVDLAGVVDLAAERSRLEKEIRRAAETVSFIETKLARADFVERAPAEIVEKERQRLREQRETRAKLEASLGWIRDGD